MRKGSMAQLIVRNLEESLVRELKVRTARNGRSAEEEHREILREALKPEQRRPSLKQLIEEMPYDGTDDDFERQNDVGRDIDL
jgi:plasmid stability protein